MVLMVLKEIKAIKETSGDKGNPGDDYVITQNDYNEIADVVMDNFEPLTQAQYDALQTIDPNKFYYIIES